MLIERGQHGRETRGRGEVVASERLQELASRTWNVSCHHYCGILLRSNSMGVVRKIISQRGPAPLLHNHTGHTHALQDTPRPVSERTFFTGVLQLAGSRIHVLHVSAALKTVRSVPGTEQNNGTKYVRFEFRKCEFGNTQESQYLTGRTNTSVGQNELHSVGSPDSRHHSPFVTAPLCEWKD